MKAFTFRLEQALRWRETQVDLQKSRVAGAAGRLAEIAAILDARRAELANAATRIADGPTGASLASYSGFREKSRARIHDLEAQSLVAQRALTLEMNGLIAANQRSRLLENLKRTDQCRWRREFDRELAAFADEAFLSRIQSKQPPPEKPVGLVATESRLKSVARALVRAEPDSSGCLLRPTTSPRKSAGTAD